ncbi:MAG: formylmethanofuran dehydrogenase subunit C [Planctomycetes bacterium]|nr:formylmethanofuran dehydrogenase subunit C [Planctomycetota bacterium]
MKLAVMLSFALVALVFAVPGSAAEKQSPLDFTMKSIDGKDVDLSKYKGDVILIVNVASRCGLTPQYAQLEEIYTKYKDKGLQVLGFPANEFGKQEPGTDAQIKEFCTSKFDVDFPMFSKIVVNGNAGDWVGAEMHGGRIHIRGDAGHLVGAVYRGGRRGMTGGEILIDGDAGNEIGHTMRRGTIAVGGCSGDAAGFNMIAGSVFLFGEPGIRPGAGMRRGTIVFGGSATTPDVLPTFKFACTYRPVFLQFYFRQLESFGFPVPENCPAAAYHRYCGDFLESGKGEILIRAAD